MYKPLSVDQQPLNNREYTVHNAKLFLTQFCPVGGFKAPEGSLCMQPR